MSQSLRNFVLAKRVERSLAAQSTGADRYIGALLVLSAVLLVAGVAAPVINVDRLFIFSQSFSILEAIGQLFEEGHYLIGTVILLFSVVVPLSKIAAAFRVWRSAEVDSARFQRILRALELLGKWSMLDVFVVAVIIVSLKAGSLSRAELQPGLYMFAGSILMSMLAVHRIRRLASRLA